MATETFVCLANGQLRNLDTGAILGSVDIMPTTVSRTVAIPAPQVAQFTPTTINASTLSRSVAVSVPTLRISRTFAAPALSRTASIPTPTVSGGAPLSNSFVGAPPYGKFYVSWADGPTTSGHTGGPTTDHGAISYGQFVCLNKLSVRHGYSSDTNARPASSIMDEAINAGLISSQSFKLGTAGNENAGADTILAGGRDADLDIAISRCLARAPWPIWLTFYHEPGGNWNTTALRTKFRACFRYIVQYFRDNGDPSNVMFQPILEAPYDFRPSNYSPGGGRGIDWRELHPDWNGGNTHTIADWYTGSDRMCDAFGLDIYNPLVGGTSFQDYSNIWTSLLTEFDADDFPYQDYAFNVMEMGWSDVITPDPDWLAYRTETLAMQAQFNITNFTYWDINNNTPPRYCLTTPASDVNGDKLAGWQDIVEDPDCIVWVEP